jgi:hypothetical protein
MAKSQPDVPNSIAKLPWRAKHNPTSVRIPCNARGFLLAAITMACTISFITTWTFFQTHSTLPLPQNKPQPSPAKIARTTSTITMASNRTKNTNKNDDESIIFRFIISSECSSYQLWETLTSFHAAEAIHQCGRFTWIISGCLPNERLQEGVRKSGANSDLLTPEVIQRHVEQHFPSKRIVPSDCSRLRPELHFTPDYSDMSVYGGPYADGKTIRYFVKKDGSKQRSSYGNQYVFNNKPNGLLHWAEAHKDEDVDEVIVLIDPDFLFLTKFHLARPDVTVVGRQHENLRDRDIVFPGQPAAASYGLGSQWLEFDLVKICGNNSHCTNTTRNEVYQHYSAGPPYILHRKDVLPLAKKWASLVPGVYDEYPQLYAEMYAYSMASAHLQLKHNLVNNLFTGCMIGWPDPNRWSKNDKKMKALEIAAVHKSAQVYRTSLEAELTAVAEGKPYQDRDNLQQQSGPGSCFKSPLLPPPMLHYCQRYFVKASDTMKQVTGNSNVTYRFFAKRRVDHNSVLACGRDKNHQGFKGGISQSRFVPFGSNEEHEEMAGGSEDWNTLAVCAITRALNFAKEIGCANQEK